MAKEKEQKFFTKKHLARAERERNQTRILVITLIAFGLILVGIIGYGLLDQYVISDLKPVAKIDGKTISVKEYQKQAQMTRFEEVNRYSQDKQIYDFYTQFGMSPDSQLVGELYTLQIELSDTRTFGQKVLNNMIEYRILQAKAAELGVSLTDAEVDDVLHSSFGFYPSGTPTSQLTSTAYYTPTYSSTQNALLITPTSTQDLTPSPTASPTATEVPELTPTESLQVTPTVTLAATLELPLSTLNQGPTAAPENTATPYPTATEYTLEGYRQEFAQYLQQISSYGIIDTDVREYIRYKLLKEKVFNALIKDLPTQGEQVWARHILLDTEDTANTALKRLNSGENWIALTQELSLDSYTKNYGGDLGWFPKGLQSTQFDDAAFSMKIGELKIVSDDTGWHIIQVLGYEKERPYSTAVINQTQSNAYNSWYDNIKSTMKIETFDRWISYVPVVPTLPASQ
jgi:parvulin-like peptidyl-prolyl isomerase